MICRKEKTYYLKRLMIKEHNNDLCKGLNIKKAKPFLMCIILLNTTYFALYKMDFNIVCICICKMVSIQLLLKTNDSQVVNLTNGLQCTVPTFVQIMQQITGLWEHR